MKKNHLYIQHENRFLESGQFEHVMAIFINPANRAEGVIRCIISREGSVDMAGLVDRSVLHKVKSVPGLEQFNIEEELRIEGQERVINTLTSEGWTFIGLEDPDLITDPDTGLLHIYFTIAFVNQDKTEYKTYLGHAKGADIDSLVMTMPVLSPTKKISGIVKELSLAPVNQSGVRLNLVESNKKIDGRNYSVIQTVVVKDLDKDWEFGDVIFNPLRDGYDWCRGHASPGQILPETFINVGQDRRVCILNGREADVVGANGTKLGVFSVGLCIYNFEKGKIEWVSKTPLIKDTEAKNITFASQFIQSNTNEGRLYAHVDDSFIRAYTLYADQIKKVIESKI